MHFRDCCAAIGLEVTKHLFATSGEDIDLVAVKMIEWDYVDDRFGGGTNEDVLQLMEKRLVKTELESIKELSLLLWLKEVFT